MSGHRSTQVAILWIAALVALSLAPPRLPYTSQGTLAHKILHVVVFGLTAIVVFRASSKPVWRFLSPLFLLLLAAAIEFGQSRIYHNRIEWQDILLDACGILAAAALAAVLVKHR